ncbi:hypothetical protein P152DRAFT_14482 [Eremomyces bilateralis CBS 781.70]|uniref:Uncharacterized protein n=1 Tax=Eremomyces bilateralis CBS 781.70 TaxID=1392243 RepID=A0A6G1GGZ8_9PEZI|nr:uncharacterized protein P152DRAFT_14482 [Eremomyces bilateralis CBS 781.70]KAF1817284.1 hypothetical protein P152DRAFT_14482 [Eremomyces bilateralis CBS 781.70]
MNSAAVEEYLRLALFHALILCTTVLTGFNWSLLNSSSPSTAIADRIMPNVIIFSTLNFQFALLNSNAGMYFRFSSVCLAIFTAVSGGLFPMSVWHLIRPKRAFWYTHCLG